jgi:YspA, cpYpsA-related SLOG family
MRIIVCGGRDYHNQSHFFDWLDKFHAKFTIVELIEGGAKGADRLARDWGQKNKITVIEVQALWEKFGTRAGPIRNQIMIDYKPDAVVAFPGGKGTNNMASIAKRDGIKVYDGDEELEPNEA